MFQSTADDSIENDDISDHFFFAQSHARGATATIVPTPTPSLLNTSFGIPADQSSSIAISPQSPRSNIAPSATAPIVSPNRSSRRVSFGPVTIIDITPRVTQETQTSDNGSQSLFDSQSMKDPSVPTQTDGLAPNRTQLPLVEQSRSTSAFLSLISDNRAPVPAPSPQPISLLPKADEQPPSVITISDFIDSMESADPEPVFAPTGALSQEPITPAPPQPATPQQHEASFAQFEVFTEKDQNEPTKKKRRTEGKKAPAIPAEHSIRNNPWTLSKKNDTSQRDAFVDVDGETGKVKADPTNPKPTSKDDATWLADNEQPINPASGSMSVGLYCDICRCKEVMHGEGMIVCARPTSLNQYGRPYPAPINASRTGLENMYFVHGVCAAWCPEVHFDAQSDSYFGILPAIARGSQIKCANCRSIGATIGCVHAGCPRSYHYQCITHDSRPKALKDFTYLCPKHTKVAGKAVASFVADN
eukprot:GILI01020994.1.p1 GENE.GILI01020994.1~~GILI01020994.1.p1  ORF type:complete len:486 (-),score=63.19 GILI01020994.1:75-1496(-)